MRIGVNTRLLLNGKMDGIGWFTFETLSRMVVNHPEHEFFFFFDRKFDDCFIFAENVHPVVLLPPARHPVLWFCFFELSMASALRKYKIDVLLSPECYIPLHSSVPMLSTVHDINFEHTRGNLKPSHQLYMDFFARRFARRSTRLATVSEFSKKDIVATYGVDADKIDVVYNGANEGYRTFSAEEQDLVRSRFSGGCPYFIFISTILKRKNLATLLKAFDKYKYETEDSTKLLVAGNPVWWQDELKVAYDSMRYQNDVVLVGRVSQDDLYGLLGSSVGLVYPSLFEGFGIPILEAFRAEVPVVASNTTSMPEVAGDAAILVDPLDVDGMADAMMRVAKDEVLRLELVERGCQQREKFSWDQSASKLWSSLMRTYKEGVANA